MKNTTFQTASGVKFDIQHIATELTHRNITFTNYAHVARVNGQSSLLAAQPGFGIVNGEHLVGWFIAGKFAISDTAQWFIDNPNRDYTTDELDGRAEAGVSN